MSAGSIEYDVEHGLGRIRLNRPEKRNALSPSMIVDLSAAFDAATGDDKVGIVMLEAQGPAFCAGMDLREANLADAKSAARFARLLSRLYTQLLTFNKPLLAGVEGPVYGGGLGLVTAADIVWVDPGARFALSEVRLGFVPALVSVVLRRRLSAAKLSTMALSGATLDALEALSYGLAEHRVEGNVVAEVTDYARGLLRDNAAGAMARTKTFLRGLLQPDLSKEFQLAEEEFCAMAATAEARRGLEAFGRRQALNWNEGPSDNP